ncbi:ABC transporter substrate-binding protein [Pigmentiphaga litoralis]|uniref:Sulfonate transport system substrate-binding protein n=1 Tax=Pigmentiphaga litoralis TaxID=516702 RepID=A0A7Y9IYR9_9BURK|nr:ABC transporter substrate-binding protein [Pigmentiphaga litoralis]NYE26341.1 ABC-type nitrate/sulfonate/bicarbonate transport system substrate-binding protein [Pigmentiphaga litoralis]NYE85461.1 sulfonate transport system substrate-binding protein [Pigmentiphaga litoralis]
MKLRFGAHPSNLTLTAITHHAPLQQSLRDAGHDPEFLWYPEGRLMQDLAASGKVNVIGTGTTRAVVAQAEGLQIAYIGASTQRRSWSAILVPEGSPIKTASDLAGKRIGLIEGSFQTYFLLAALDKVGLNYESVDHRNLKPGESQAALRAGDIDAWVAMDPYLTTAFSAGGLTKVAECDGVISNRSVFWVLQDVVDAGPEVVQTVFDALAATDAWIGADPARAGALFAKCIGNGLSADEWAKGIAKREWGIHLPDAELIQEQQTEADLLAKHALLSRRINVNDAVLPFALHARAATV